MRILAMLPTSIIRGSAVQCVMLSSGLFVATSVAFAQSPTNTQPAQAKPQTSASHVRHAVKKQKPAPTPVAQAAAGPPLPHWPQNDQPTPASVVWDANGLHINASNSSLQQILNEVSTETGSKVEGLIPDQRIYGDYGPGQARDVLSQLLQGSGYNVLLAGDLGKGAPREIVLSPRRASAPNSQNANASRPQTDPDDEIPEPPEDQPQPAVQPQLQNNIRPGFGPNGPVRTPQQVMEEMQQRQLQQQQQMQQQLQQQQQQQQQNPQ